MDYKEALNAGDAAVCDYWSDWLSRIRPKDFPRPKNSALRERLASATEKTIRATLTDDSGRVISYDLPARETPWMFDLDARKASGVAEVRIESR